MYGGVGSEILMANGIKSCNKCGGWDPEWKWLNLNLFTVRIRVSVIRGHRGVMHHRPFMAFKIFFPMPSVGAFTSGLKSSILPSGGMFKSTINLLIFVPATPLDCVSRPTSEALDP
ncbi:hypothetical protein PIB30_077280 [Stylosanthes scabra]|uniref:Uncharacterized protein n=1 Tax=Stylosanthes scabra TaxID=79078 RepID=A0ABU6YT77_9FABA|nr:hypothetical protein [Stylosanthes scabra]